MEYRGKLIKVCKALTGAYIVTGLLLLLLSFLLFKLNLGEKEVSIGIVVIYILSSFIGGFFIGKVIGYKKFLWGCIVGASYFLILFLMSIAVHHGLNGEFGHKITTFVLCTAGGMLGGMLS